MISIIIPTHNDLERLTKSLVTVNLLEYPDCEVVIVDDGSDEPIEPALADIDFAFPTHIHRLEKNGGAPAARNYGFEQSKGEYVIFWDADIIGRNDMLDVMHEELSTHSEVSYVYSSYWWGSKKFEQWAFDADKLKEVNYIHTTSLMRREHFPGFDTSLKRFQDWDLWLTMLEQGHSGRFIPEYLFRVQTGGSMSSWLPKVAYTKPFRYLLPKKMREQIIDYETAKEIIKNKHNLKT